MSINSLKIFRRPIVNLNNDSNISYKNDIHYANSLFDEGYVLGNGTFTTYNNETNKDYFEITESNSSDPHVAVYDLPKANSWTVVFDCYLENTGNFAMLQYNGAYYDILFNTSKLYSEYRQYASSSANVYKYDNLSFLLNSWHKIMIRHNGSNLYEIFIDGVLHWIPENYISSSQNMLQLNLYGLHNKFRNFVCYNRALTNDEILTLKTDTYKMETIKLIPTSIETSETGKNIVFDPIENNGTSSIEISQEFTGIEPVDLDISIDILEKNNINTEIDLSMTETYFENTIDNLTGYKIDLNALIESSTDFIIISQSKIKLPIDVDILLINDYLIEILSKTQDGTDFIYEFNEIKEKILSVKYSVAKIQSEGIVTNSINGSNLLEGSYKIANNTQKPWLGFEVTATEKVIDLKDFKYIDSSTFKCSDDLEVGTELLQKNNILTTILNKVIDIDGLFKYTIEVKPQSVRHIQYEKDSLDRTWSTPIYLNEDEKTIHMIDNNIPNELEIDMNNYIDDISGITLKMRVYSIGVWNDNNDDKAMLHVNGIKKWESKRNYNNGQGKMLWDSYSAGGTRYRPDTTDLGDWTSYESQSMKNSYTYYYTYGYHYYYTASTKKTFNMAGYKDIEVIIPKDEIINNDNKLKISMSSTLKTPRFRLLNNFEDTGGAAAGFSDVEVLLNFTAGTKSHIQKLPDNYFEFKNHKNEIINNSNLIISNRTWHYPYVSTSYETKKLVGYFYDFKVKKETLDSFKDISIITKTK